MHKTEETGQTDCTQQTKQAFSLYSWSPFAPAQLRGAWLRAAGLLRLCAVHVKKLAGSSYMGGPEPHRSFYLIFYLAQESYVMEKKCS